MKKIRKYILWIAVMVFCMFPGMISRAENVYTDGDYSYTKEYGKATLYKYNGSASHVTVPSTLGGLPVVSVHYYAFKENPALVSVTLPDSITFIDSAAFEECENLQYVHLPESITEIPSYIFRDCPKLVSVNIPSGVTEIGYDAFMRCTSLTRVETNAVLEEIEDGAFYGCTSLTSVIFHNGVKVINEQVFYGCTSLATVSLGGTTKSIDAEAFVKCTSLKSIILPSTLTSIDFGVFAESGLTSITIPESVTFMDMCVFSNCRSLQTANIYGAVSLNYMTFENCVSLHTVNLGYKVRSIEHYAFAGTQMLTTIRIPKDTKVDSWAFKECEGLIKILGAAGSEAETVANAIGVVFTEVDDVKISLNKSKVTLYLLKGKKTQTLQAIVEGTASKPTWTSSKTSVVQVNASGKITAKKAGKAVITAKLGNKKVTCTVTVKKPSFKLKKTSITLKKGKTYEIKYSAAPKNTVTYKSSSKKTASVNKNGVVKAKKKGTAVITVKCNGITRKLRVRVK